MAGKLVREIHQTKPFGTVEEEAVVSITLTAEMLGQYLAEFLKPHGISIVQYNALRILRGAGADGVTCSQLGERLLSKDPDITRLIDRMESAGLAVRERSREDRRVVVTRIAKKGRELVNRLDQPVRTMTRSTAGLLSKSELIHLIDMLEKIRERLA